MVANAAARIWSSVCICRSAFSETAPELIRALVICSDGALRESTSRVRKQRERVAALRARIGESGSR